MPARHKKLCNFLIKKGIKDFAIFSTFREIFVFTETLDDFENKTVTVLYIGYLVKIHRNVLIHYTESSSGTLKIVSKLKYECNIFEGRYFSKKNLTIKTSKLKQGQ